MPPLIVVDWGTTNFRAYLVEHGVCQDDVQAPDGLLNIQGDYAKALNAHIGHWLQGQTPTPILLSGMVSSPNGWIEVAHVECPANAEKLARRAYQIEDFNQGKTWIIPGLSATGMSGQFDVMRGEEIQYFGAKRIVEAENLAPADAFCFPGTHNKWINATDSFELEQFSTSMTGELFALLSGHSLLSKSMNTQGPWQDNAFLQGLNNSGSKGGIMHQLFTVRSLQLSGAHTIDDGEAYLSGLLIGSEIRSILHSEAAEKAANIAVVGSDELTLRYKSAIEHLGYSAFIIDAQAATISGALEVAKHLNHQV